MDNWQSAAALVAAILVCLAMAAALDVSMQIMSPVSP